MDVFSMELGIRLSFVKISGEGFFDPPPPILYDGIQSPLRN
jgi:hypothetical protein